jgi:hypothetical protein
VIHELTWRQKVGFASSLKTRIFEFSPSLDKIIAYRRNAT